MYDITQLTFLTSPIAFALTYLLHSTAWILLMLCIVRLPIFSTPLLKNYLWKGALVGGLLTSLLIHFSGNSLLEIQITKESSNAITSIQQPNTNEQLLPIKKVELIPIEITTPIAQEPLVIEVEPTESKVEPILINEPISSLTIEKETPISPFKILPFILFVACCFWAIGTFFFITKETIRHFVFIRKIGERTRINHPTFKALLQQIRLKLGQRLKIDLSHSPILESPILIKNQEICLPEKALSKLNTDQIEAMLAHEMAHVVRKDYYWNCFLLGLDTLLFFQPLHRLAIKEIQTTNELLCDEWAAKIIDNNLALAQCLLTVATWMKTPAKSYPLVAGMSLKKSELSNRITSLINLPDMKKQRFNFLKAGLPFVAFLALAILVLPGFTFTGIKDTTTISTNKEDSNADAITYHQPTKVPMADDEPTKTDIEEDNFKTTKRKQLRDKLNESTNKDKDAVQDFNTLEILEEYTKHDVSTVEKLENEFKIKYLDLGIPFHEKKYTSIGNNKLDVLRNEKKSPENNEIGVKNAKTPTIRLEEKFSANKNHKYFDTFDNLKERDGTAGKEYIKSIYFANLSCAGASRKKLGGPLVTNKDDKNSLIFTLDYGDHIEYDTLQNCVHPPDYDDGFEFNLKGWLPNLIGKRIYKATNIDIQGNHPDVVETQWVQQSDNQKQTPIGIKLKDRADVFITVETTKGQPVLVVANGVFEAGTHEFIFPHVNIKKGTYRLITTINGETLSQNIRVKRTRFTNKKEKNTCAALLRAVKGNNAQKVKVLVHTVDPNCEYRAEGEPRSPLNAAARKGNVEIGKLLLAANADVEFRARGDEGALMGAARKGHLDFVKLMVENGAKVNKVVHGDGTALINAVRGGHFEVAEYLLEHGADPMLNVPGDENPIAHAVNQGDEMLDLLLKYRKSK